jgi:FkbM family methyltransferase
MSENPRERVKIGRFLDMGIPISTLIHVGVNDGYEIEWYRKLGIRVLGFEPHPSAYAQVTERFLGDGGVLILPLAIGHHTPDRLSLRKLRVPVVESDGRLVEDSYQSSLYYELAERRYVVRQCLTMPLDYCADLSLFGEPDCIVIDVQGAELEVLETGARCLRHAKCLNIECSRVPVYVGEAPAEKVISYLRSFRFTPITPIEDHDDILFVKEEYL